MQPLQLIFSITNNKTHKIIQIFGIKIKIKRRLDIIEQINNKFAELNTLQNYNVEKNTEIILQEIKNKINKSKAETISNNYTIINHIYKNIVEQLENCKAENRIINNQQTSKIIEAMCLTTFPGKDIFNELKKIYQQYPKANGFLKDVQLCNLELLIALKKITNEIGINYWLHAGTLIGALRNEGFIPWDDDVDVAMLRSDFEKLQEYVRNNKDYKIYQYYNDITCSRHYQFKNRKIPNFIDIVIYDQCSISTIEELEEFEIKYTTIRNELVNKFKEELNCPKVNNIGYYHVGIYDDLIKEKVDKLITEANKKLITIKPNNIYYFYAIENYPFSYPVIKENELFPLKTINFESIELQIPQKAIKYLEGYGNIFYPPGDIHNSSHIYAFKKHEKEIKEFIKKNQGEKNEKSKN